MLYQIGKLAERACARVLEKLKGMPFTGGHILHKIRAAITLIIEKSTAGHVVVTDDMVNEVETRLAAEVVTLVRQPQHVIVFCVWHNACPCSCLLLPIAASVIDMTGVFVCGLFTPLSM